MNHNLTIGMKIWKGNGNTTTLLFSLKGIEILHQEIRGQVNTVVIGHFKRFLFHKSEPANKQRRYGLGVSVFSCLLSMFCSVFVHSVDHRSGEALLLCQSSYMWSIDYSYFPDTTITNIKAS
jgi:hypothetical protein